MQSHNCYSYCASFSKTDTKNIFKHFSSLDEQSKLKFIDSMVKLNLWQAANSKLLIHRRFHLPKGKRVFRVCHQTFKTVLQLNSSEYKNYIIKRTNVLTKKQETKELSVVLSRMENSTFTSMQHKTDLSSSMETPPENYSLKVKSTDESEAANEFNTVLSSKYDCWVQTDTPESHSFHDIKQNKTVASVSTQANIKQLTAIDGKMEYRIEYITKKDIKLNPMLFIGVPNLTWIDKVCNCVNCVEEDLFVIFRKIRLNNSFKELAFHFQKSEEDILKIWNHLTPFVEYVLKDMLEWQDFKMNLNVDQSDSKEKNYCISSVLKLVTISAGSNHKLYKFFISITPLGTISFVSKLFCYEEKNSVVLHRSEFFKEAPKNCGIILDSSLSDIVELLNRNGYTVFLDNFLKAQDSQSQKETFTKRDFDFICKNVNHTFKRFKEFEILNNYSDNNSIGTLNHAIKIIAELVNIQAFNDTEFE